jgi:hypothetical protein
MLTLTSSGCSMGFESGLDEVLADERTKLTRQELTAARPSYLPQKG